MLLSQISFGSIKDNGSSNKLDGFISSLHFWSWLAIDDWITLFKTSVYKLEGKNNTVLTLTFLMMLIFRLQNQNEYYLINLRYVSHAPELVNCYLSLAVPNQYTLKSKLIKFNNKLGT